MESVAKKKWLSSVVDVAAITQVVECTKLRQELRAAWRLPQSRLQPVCVCDAAGLHLNDGWVSG